MKLRHRLLEAYDVPFDIGIKRVWALKLNSLESNEGVFVTAAERDVDREMAKAKT